MTESDRLEIEAEQLAITGSRLPLVEKLRQSRASGVPHLIRLPWEARAEQLTQAVVCLSSEWRRACRVLSGGDQIDFSLGNWIVLARNLNAAQTYLWSNRISNSVDAYPVPRHVVSAENLPHDLMYWTFESAGVSENGGKSDWILVQRAGGSLVFFEPLTYDDEGRCDMHIHRIPTGTTFPDALDAQSVPHVKRLLAMIAFLNSPYIDVAKQKHPRAFRRHDLQQDPAECERLVNVVQLRAAQHHQDESTPSSEASRSYDRRWWVRGHIRAQWYPSEEAHKLVWIAPYLKGPGGAPMVEKVHAVRR